MKRIKEVASATLKIAVAAVLVLGWLYLRNGSEYFAGTSGGAYWDHMDYCKTHPAGRQKIYNELVSCNKIMAARAYCRHHLNDVRQIGGGTASCDDILDIEPPPTPWDGLD